MYAHTPPNRHGFLIILNRNPMEQNDNHGSTGVAGSSRGPSQVRQFLSELAYGALIFTCQHCHCLYLLKWKQQLLVCSECGITFTRQQDQDQHFQSFHLLCWLFCPYPDCRWRGDHVDKFQRHLITQKCSPRPSQEQQYQIYNVKMVMNWIKNSQGSNILTARNFAANLVKERALELGRQEWLGDPWGCLGRRTRDQTSN